MRNISRLLACAILSLTITSAFAAELRPAQNHNPDQTEQQLRALNSAVDELKSTIPDMFPEQRTSRGERLNQAFVALTGEAVNPLFGITALGMFNYFRTPETLRDSLPLYDQPIIWAPLLIIILLMLFNSTICEAVPFLKVPLNALGDIVNKAGAVAVLPLVVKMFADAVAQPAARELAGLADALFPVAYAGEAGMLSSAWLSLGWAAGALAGTVIYLAVWLTFNVIDVLILVCPFPGVDAMLKSFRLAIVGLLAGANHLSPATAFVIAAVIVLVSLFLAGWSFRLSVFGFVFSTDIIFFRKKEISPEGASAFSCTGMPPEHKVPVRTLGRLEKDAAGRLRFSYRPWLVMRRRSVELGDSEKFLCGRGLLNPFVVAESDHDTPWLRLPPRYRGRENELAGSFSLAGVVDCGISGALRTWLGRNFGGGKRTAGEVSA